MIGYILKVILCSGIFLITYKLLLEKERMAMFNRVYLLSTLLLSLLIPLITFNSFALNIPVAETVKLNADILQENVLVPMLAPVQSENYTFEILLTLYATVSFLLFVRFIVNLTKILYKAKTNPTLPHNSIRIVLIKDNLVPHSFFNYLFINEPEFRNGNVENAILLHEYAHIDQKHSYDVVLIELFQILLWFNPFVYMYRKAIQLNHEFLADEAVLQRVENISSYQYLLIAHANKGTTYNITSQFNYSLTKKRLLMMTKSKSPIRSLCKKIALIPVVAVSIFVFSDRSFAQDSIKAQKAIPNVIVATQDGVSKELLNEYEDIVNRAKNEKTGFPSYNKFSDADKEKLEGIFLLMNKEQQDQQIVIFRAAPGPLPKVVPTKTQIESWKNPRLYGVWINNKRVNNTELNKYVNTDFAQVFVSKLGKNTVNYGKHFYQVDLMTIEGYEVYHKKTVEAKNTYHMAFRMRSKKTKSGDNG